jgi:hypothetical protein
VGKTRRSSYHAIHFIRRYGINKNKNLQVADDIGVMDKYTLCSDHTGLQPHRICWFDLGISLGAMLKLEYA